jgi:hypothetical protein
VDTVTVPILGPVPVPLALLVVGLLVGYAVARLLGAHAGWLGRRWAAAVRDDVGRAVRGVAEREAFASVDAIEAGRDRMAAASARARDCRVSGSGRA